MRRGEFFSFVIIISTSTLMLHDCLETFSHFVVLFFSSARAINTSGIVLLVRGREKGIKNMVFLSSYFSLKQGNEFFFQSYMKRQTI